MKKPASSEISVPGRSPDSAEPVPLPTRDGLRPAGLDPDAPTPTPEIEQALRQTINSALDFTNWEEGGGLGGLQKAQAYLTESLKNQERVLRNIRKLILTELASYKNAPATVGVYPVTEPQLRRVRRIALSGKMTAIRGASAGHEGLGGSLVSVGICLTRYDGHVRSWRNMFFRHDCDLRRQQPVDEIRAILNHEARRSRTGPGSRGPDNITRLMRRAFQSAAERKALLEKVGAGWKMGYGQPAPYELLTGSGAMTLIDAALPVLKALLLDEKRWVFIPETNHAYMRLAMALKPGELAIITNAKSTLENIVDRGHYESEYKSKVRQFTAVAGEAMVMGAFRATPYAPPQLFFAHAEHALHAGLIAMADAELQPHRGFPLLLELADISCQSGLGIDAFQAMVGSAYAKAGAGHFYSPDGVSLSDAED